jgi:GTP:adenosylcobinamide-phosphate guanylyltransferase
LIALQGSRSPCFKPFWQACGKSFLSRLVNKMA